MPWDWKKMEIIILGVQIFESNFIPTKSNSHEKPSPRYWYHYFRGHWYDMGLEEAEEFSCICISPLATLLSFPWHE